MQAVEQSLEFLSTVSHSLVVWPRKGGEMTTSSVFEKWFPVTSDFGLIEAPLESISELYQSWWTDIGKEVSVKVSTGKTIKCSDDESLYREKAAEISSGNLGGL